MSIVNDLKPLLRQLRGIPGAFGLRSYTVEIVRINTEGGAEAWDGTRALTEEQVTELVEGDNQPPRVRWLTTKDYLNGYPQDCQLEVTITAGLTASIADIQEESNHTFFRLKGPGLGENGTIFRKAYLNTQSALSWKIGLKRMSTSNAA